MAKFVRVFLTGASFLEKDGRFTNAERGINRVFQHPLSGANGVTTDNYDWTTNCTECKVAAVKVSQPSEWQSRYEKFLNTR